jgi:hypothetical protein
MCENSVVVSGSYQLSVVSFHVCMAKLDSDFNPEEQSCYGHKQTSILENEKYDNI